MLFPERAGSQRKKRDKTVVRRRASKIRRRTFLPGWDFMEVRQLLTTFYVENTLDSGPGSLRYAISQANADPTTNHADLIEPGVVGLGTIYPGTNLPAITRADVTVEDLSIEGAGRPHGSGSAFRSAYGLKFSGSGDAAVDVSVSLFASSGIYVAAGSVQITGSTISDNTGPGITLDANMASLSGNIVVNNDGSGIVVYGSDNQIGVPTGSGRPSITTGGNQISGNRDDGISVVGTSTSDVIEGNLIGTDTTGTQPLGNSDQGIYLGSETYGNTVGATTAGAGNIISANGNEGIWIDGGSKEVVLGNLIGTDASGNTALGNAYSGIYFDAGASYNTIGGTGTGAGNVISGNHEFGIEVVGYGTSQNLVIGDEIGTTASGDAPLENSDGGVFAFSDGSLTIESNVNISGELLLTGAGSLNVTGSSNTVNGGLYMSSGALTVSGTNASLSLTGSTTLSGGTVNVDDGGALKFDRAHFNLHRFRRQYRCRGPEQRARPLWAHVLAQYE